MKLMKISELTNLSPKDTVPCVRGQLVEIYQRHTGTSAKGPWSLQNAVLQDDTGRIKIKLDGVPELPANLKGREVMLFSNNGDGGLTWDEESYKGTITQILHLTKSGELELVNSKTEPAQETPASVGATPPPASAKPQVATTTPPAASAPPKPNGNGHPVNANGKKVDERLSQFAKLYLRCLDAATYVAKQYCATHQTEMLPEQFQACASSLFIQATKDSLYLNL